MAGLPKYIPIIVMISLAFPHTSGLVDWEARCYLNYIGSLVIYVYSNYLLVGLFNITQIVEMLPMMDI